jgi:agmatinase
MPRSDREGNAMLDVSGKQVVAKAGEIGLDPAYAPGTGTPEPGGLNYHQLVDLFLAVGKTKHIVGADIVEVIPNLPGVVTEFLAARLAYKIIAAAQLKD